MPESFDLYALDKEILDQLPEIIGPNRDGNISDIYADQEYCHGQN